MAIFTSNFKIAGRNPDAIAISQGIPWWFRGRAYKTLAPHRWMIGLGGDGAADSEARFRGLYSEEILAPLDVSRVVADFGENAILLCWEAPGLFCHRRLVAEWIESKTGMVIAEWPHQIVAPSRAGSARPRRRRRQ
jgi:hypothetical protein